MEKGLTMWKHIILFVPLFFAGMLLDCLLEPGGVVSFRETSSVALRGKATGKSNTTTSGTNDEVANPPPKELTRAESRALFLSLSPEERQKVLVEEIKILWEARSGPRAKENSIFRLYEEHRKNFDLLFKYNQIPDDVRKKILTVLANSDFEFTENYYTADVTQRQDMIGF
jgi:hypothetical protein